MDLTESSQSAELFLDVPYEKRWECHKERIVSMYLGKDKEQSVEAIARVMKSEYKFDANVRSYKYHLKKWGISRNISSSVKDQAIKAIGKRVRDGSAVGGVRYKGEEVDKKRLRRHLNSQSRLCQDLQFDKIIFVHWNFPHKALRVSSMCSMNTPSPFGVNASTPSDISVFSPYQITSAPSPVSAPTPLDAPSPMTVAIRERTCDERARLLIQGKPDEFLKDMSGAERSVATTWLHHFLLFAFKTAKHWGRGPTMWSPELLQFAAFLDVNTTPNTPAALSGVGAAHPLSEAVSCREVGVAQLSCEPTRLCHWGIHCRLPAYERVPSPPESPEERFDLDNPEAWPAWNRDAYRLDLVDRLQKALQSNHFSNIDAKDLPLSTTRIANAAACSHDELLVESLGFAIIARNERLLWDIFDQHLTQDIDLTRLFPYHLATTYIDGAKTCCNVLHTLLLSLAGRNTVKKLYINNLGHSVLDSLMISIIKGHTSCTPAAVSTRLKRAQRFVGEDVDTCGRWDSDSPCVRALHASGAAKVPFAWKHMFCHTSVQAVCHSITAIFTSPSAPDINTPSGLFKNTCGNCNANLELLPLHTLVLITLHLAQSGCKGENLFGALACLVCLLVHGANPLKTTVISVATLLGTDDGEHCSHAPIDPVELAEQVLESLSATWTDDVKVGWKVFLGVLRLAQQSRNSWDSPNADGTAWQPGSRAMNLDADYVFAVSDDEMSIDSEEADSDASDRWCEHWEGSENFYGGSKALGTLWAAIQTEFLTYRRLNRGDPWLSEYFSMRAVLRGLNDNDPSFRLLPLVDCGMMQPFCKCGRFLEAESANCPTSVEACAFYFSNLEDWERSTYLTMLEWTEL